MWDKEEEVKPEEVRWELPQNREPCTPAWILTPSMAEVSPLHRSLSNNGYMQSKGELERGLEMHVQVPSGWEAKMQSLHALTAQLHGRIFS